MKAWATRGKSLLLALESVVSPIASASRDVRGLKCRVNTRDSAYPYTRSDALAKHRQFDAAAQTALHCDVVQNNALQP